MGASKRPPDYQAVAIDVIAEILTNGDVSLIGLGEVHVPDVQMLQHAIVGPLQVDVTTTADTSVAFLYKPDIVTPIAVHALIDHYGRKTLCRGLEALIALNDGSLDFELFLCHWPSRMRGVQALRERNQLAISLSVRLDSAYANDFPVVVMGDFNDEPFDQSMTDHLRGSRDRQYVIDDTRLLYNPFWRQLGERQDISDESGGRLAPGTHFYRSDQLTHWLTVDQALVSREFLGRNKWVLNEAETGPIQLPPLITEKGRLKRGFDHFPIVVTFDRPDQT